MLIQRERSSSYESSIKQLQQDLSLARVEVTKVESSLSEALAAKNAEIETLLGSVDSLKNQASSAEGKIATLQVLFLYPALLLLHGFLILFKLYLFSLLTLL